MMNTFNMQGWKDKVNALWKVSPYQELIDEATSEFLLTPAWEKNINIIDQINRKPEEAKEVLFALRRRTSNVNPKVQFLSLNLLEMCLKNCGGSFRAALCEQKDLLADIVKIATKDTRKPGEQEAQLKGLELIYTCHHSFRSRMQYQALSSLYSQALQKGANFAGIEVKQDSLVDPDSPEATRMRGGSGGGGGMNDQRTRRTANSVPTAARNTQQAGTGGSPHHHSNPTLRTNPTPGGQHQQQQGRQPCPAAIAEQQQALAALGLGGGEQSVESRAQAIQQLIDEAGNCIALLTEVMTAQKDTPEQLFGDELCQQVYLQTKNVATNIVNILQSGAAMSTSEANFELLLQTNDILSDTLAQYEAMVSSVREVMERAMHGGNSPPRTASGAAGQQQGQAAAVVSQQQPEHKIQLQPKQTTPATQPKPAAAPMKKRDSLDDLLGLDDITVTTQQPQQSQQTTNKAFAPPVSTTQTTSQPPPSSQQQNKHDDFDDFLNERAPVAVSTPSNSSPSTNNNNTSPKAGTTTSNNKSAEDPMDDFLSERSGEPKKQQQKQEGPTTVNTTTTTTSASEGDSMDDFLSERTGEKPTTHKNPEPQTTTNSNAPPVVPTPAAAPSDPMDEFLNERTDEKTNVAPQPQAAKQSADQSAADPMDDFLNERTTTPAGGAAPPAGKTGDGLDDFLVAGNSSPPPAGAPAQPKKTIDDDEFDDFLAGRA